MFSLPDNCKITQAVPVTRGVAANGDWVCLKGYKKAMCIINIVTGADDTELTFKISRATSVAGADAAVEMTMKNFWTLYNGVSALPVADAMTKGTAATSIETLTDQSTSHMIIIDIDAEELPNSTADYDCLQLVISGGNAAHTYSAVWVLYHPRHAEAHADQLTAIAD